MLKSLTEQIKELMPEEIKKYKGFPLDKDEVAWNAGIKACKNKIPEILSLIRGEVEKYKQSLIARTLDGEGVEKIDDLLKILK